MFHDPFRVAVLQMTSGDDMAANIAQLEPLLDEAVGLGAKLIATPENTFYMRQEGTASMPDGPMETHQGIVWAQAAAKQHGVWLLIGSIRALQKKGARAFNRSVLIAPDGTLAAHYDKLHLFDVTLPNGQSYHESSQAHAGDAPVLAHTPLAALGMTICYDLRFPALYGVLAEAGAELLTVPAAFTRPTGEAHWEILLRARAIENACYVLAPAQAGLHPGGRETYGHSLIIDPWGKILAEALTPVPQVISAWIDLAALRKTRENIPVLQHRKPLAEVRG